MLLGAAVHEAVEERLKGKAAMMPVTLSAERLVRKGIGSRHEGEFKLPGGKVRYNRASWSLYGTVVLEQISRKDGFAHRLRRVYVKPSVDVVVLAGQEALLEEPG